MFAAARRDLELVEAAYDASTEAVRAAQRLQEAIEGFDALIGKQTSTLRKYRVLRPILRKPGKHCQPIARPVQR